MKRKIVGVALAASLILGGAVGVADRIPEGETVKKAPCRVKIESGIKNESLMIFDASIRAFSALLTSSPVIKL